MSNLEKLLKIEKILKEKDLISKGSKISSRTTIEDSSSGYIKVMILIEEEYQE